MNLFNLFRKKPNVKTQQECIEYHLQKYGSITLKQSINLYGISYLSGYISRINKSNKLFIKMEVKTSKNIFGLDYSYVVYKRVYDIAPIMFSSSKMIEGYINGTDPI